VRGRFRHSSRCYFADHRDHDHRPRGSDFVDDYLDRAACVDNDLASADDDLGGDGGACVSVFSGGG
jgi:hypothetical protein